eukprot:7367196-Prymnesium_polylepis.1
MRAVPMHKQVRKPERRRGHIPHACSSARPKGGAGIAESDPNSDPPRTCCTPSANEHPPKADTDV